MDIALISEGCTEYIAQSNGLPLFKNLPASNPDMVKVKVRHKNSTNSVSDAMSKAFRHQKITERSIVASGKFPPAEKEKEPFIIFLPNGFKFIYNNNAKSNEFDQLQNIISDEMLVDVLTFTYETKGLEEAIRGGGEVLLYNVPFYYAVRPNTEAVNKLISIGVFNGLADSL